MQLSFDFDSVSELKKQIATIGELLGEVKVTVVEAPKKVNTYNEVSKENGNGQAKPKGRGRPRHSIYTKILGDPNAIEGVETAAITEPTAIATISEQKYEEMKSQGEFSEPTSPTPVAPPAPVVVAPATKDEVSRAIQSVFDKKGIDTARSILTDLGHKVLRDVPPEKYAQVLVACQKALKS